MEDAKPPTPGLISSLEAMIEASVVSALDRRFGPAHDALNVQIEGAVTSALDRRGFAGIDSMDKHITQMVESTMTRRFGPIGAALNAQITLGGPQLSDQQPIDIGQQQQRQTSFGMSVVAEDDRTLEVKRESQMMQEEATRDILSTRRISPAESGTSPGTTPGIPIQGLESSSRPQTKQAQHVRASVGTSSNDSGETEDLFFTEPDSSDVIEHFAPRERELENTKRSLALPRTQENKLPLTGMPRVATGRDVTLTRSMASNQDLGTHCASRKTPSRELSFERLSHSTESSNLKNDNAPGMASSPHSAETQVNASRNIKSGQDRAAEVRGSPFTEGKAGTKPLSKIESLTKRRPSTVEGSPGAPTEGDEGEGPPTKKRASTNPPGYAEGPQIRFLKVCSELSAQAQGRRGYARVVDPGTFTDDSNKQNFTMADVVATILWNHGLETLMSFINKEEESTFSFIRKEGDKKKREFAIEQNRESGTQMIRVGHHARSPGHRWYEYFEYSIAASGRWDPIEHQIGTNPPTVNKRKIQQEAVIFGSELFRRQVWAPGTGVQIVVN